MPTEGHGGGAGWTTVTSRGVVDMSFVEEIVEAYATVASWGGVTPYSLEEEDVRLGATLTSRGAGGETTEGFGLSGSGGKGLWRTGRGLGPGMGPKFFIILKLLKR